MIQIWLACVETSHLAKLSQSLVSILQLSFVVFQLSGCGNTLAFLWKTIHRKPVFSIGIECGRAL